MALERQLVHIPLAGGVQQKVDVVALDPPNFVQIVNKHYEKDGALAPRPGYTTIAADVLGGGTFTPTGLLPSDRERLATDGVNLYAEHGAWANRGRIPWLTATERVVAVGGGQRSDSSDSPDGDCSNADFVNGGSNIWSAHVVDGASVEVRAFNPIAGTTTYANNAVTAGATASVRFCRITADAGFVWVFFTRHDGAVHEVVARVYDSAAFSFQLEHIVYSGADEVTCLDASRNPAAGPIFGAALVSFATWDGTAGATFVYGLVTTGSAFTQFTLASNSPPTTTARVISLSVLGQPTLRGVLCFITTSPDTHRVHFSVVSPTLNEWVTQSTGSWSFHASDNTTAANVGMSPLTATEVLVAIGHQSNGATVPVDYVSVLEVNVATGVNSSAVWQDGCALVSKPFLVGTRWLVAAARYYVSNTLLIDSFIATHTATVVLDVSVRALGVMKNAVIVGVLAPRGSLPNRTETGTSPYDPPQAVNVPTSVASGIGRAVLPLTTAQRTRTDASGGGAAIPFTRAVTCALLSQSVSMPHAQVGGVIVSGGSALSSYVGSAADVGADGVGGVTEYAFLHAPEQLGLTDNSGGGSVPAGAVAYRAVYEWTDDAGNICHSPPSKAASITTTAPTSIDVDVPTITLTNRQTHSRSGTPITIAVYRSIGGSEFFRLPTAGGQSGIQNDLDAGSVTFTDKNGATSVINELIYTTGGTLDDVVPPPFTALCAHKGRFFGAHGSTLWFTKVAEAASLAGWSDIGGQWAMPDGGDITGLASLDSFLLVFKKDRIFAVSGDGPGDTGAGNDYSLQRVAFGTGCQAPASVVTTHDGAFFQANDGGLWLLGRGMDLKYVGAGIEDTLAARPFIRSASYLPAFDSVVFCCDAGSTAGTLLVYSLTFERWTTWQMTPGTACVGAVVDGVHVVATAVNGGATRSVRVSGGPNDNGATAAGLFETAPIKLGGIEGFQRARRLMLLGKMDGDVDLAVGLRMDYAAGNTETVVWTAAELAALRRADGTFQVEHHIAHQKCEAVSVLASEVSNGTVHGRGITWKGLLVECGLKPTRFKGLAAAARK